MSYSARKVLSFIGILAVWAFSMAALSLNKMPEYVLQAAQVLLLQAPLWFWLYDLYKKFKSVGSNPILILVFLGVLSVGIVLGTVMIVLDMLSSILSF